MIIHHPPSFNWWPVWGVGFLRAFLTYGGGNYMALLPIGTVTERNRQVERHDEPCNVLVAPPGRQLPVDRFTDTLMQPRLQIAVFP